MEILLISLAAIVGYALASMRVLNQYERGVVFFLGRYTATQGPGLVVVPLFLARMTSSRATTSR
jgi:regulator of protease activity HflC (stomatin/prohibitin superfamily)